ncbi:MAG TPA: DNA primase [Elusimicrobiota bacterium]|nr:DNA primase [Elusimicrobiota bacterium]
MGLIPPEVLENIRSRIDIAEVVAQYVPDLRLSGRSFKGRCPFHQEKTPSFHVNAERQAFHCFGCGVGGDAFAFLMKIENLNFSEAVERLAERAGVPVSWTKESSGAGSQERRALLEALAFAADFYRDCLLKSPRAETARNYLASRKVSEQASEAFRLGYAPGGSEFWAAAEKKGLAREVLATAGLVAVKDGRPRDYFFDRVMFPIRDARGATVGFGARTLGDGEPKYLNSPESPVFSKSRVLYGLWEGLNVVRKVRKAILMEGYMDVIAAHQHGFPIACAPLGTALTPEQAALLRRYVPTVALVFDSDKAGQAAAVRGSTVMLLSKGLSVRMAMVPTGKDPDEFLNEFGGKAFKDECLAKSESPDQFLLHRLLATAGKPISREKKSSIAKEVLALIAKVPDEILKSEWIERLAQALDISKDVLFREMIRPGGLAKMGGRSQEKAPAAEPKAVAAAFFPLEDAQLLRLVFENVGPSAPALAENDFVSDAGRSIWRAFERVRSEPSWPARLLESLEEAERSCASGLLVEDKKSADSGKALEVLLARRRALRRLREIEPQIREMGDGKRPKDAALQEEYSRLHSATKRRGN